MRPAGALLCVLKLAAVAVNTLVLAPVVVAVALVNHRAAYRVCQLWVRINLAVCALRVRVRRLAPLDPLRPYVFLSNHRSQYDILGLVAALPEFQLRWVAKKELLRVPAFGWAIAHAGHIIVDRSDHAQAVASLRAVRTQMLEGVSVMIFPEGTRGSIARGLLPFKKGGFMLALETGVPIVPIAVLGSGEILPRGSWRPVAGEIEVVVGAPMPVEGMERDQLIGRARAFMCEQLGISDSGARGAGAA